MPLHTKLIGFTRIAWFYLRNLIIVVVMTFSIALTLIKPHWMFAVAMLPMIIILFAPIKKHWSAFLFVVLGFVISIPLLILPVPT